MKRASIGATSFAGSTVPCPVSPGEHLGVGDEIAMHGGGKFDRQLHRPVVGNGGELQLGQVDLLKRGRVRARDRA